MNQANVEKLVSKLRYNVKPRRRFRNPDGSEGRLLKLRKTLTALIKYERLELNYPRADETRGYVDQVCLIIYRLLLFIYFKYSIMTDK
jgi:large subunit ribosomal protein L17